MSTNKNISQQTLGKLPTKEDTEAKEVHYRLNAEERVLFEVAKRNSFLQVKNFAYRRDLGDSPLMNLTRLYCDAMAIPFVCVSTDIAVVDGSVSPHAVVKIDFSPLRKVDCRAALAKCVDEIKVENFPSIKQYDDKNLIVNGHDGEVLETAYKLSPIRIIPQRNLTVHFDVRNDGVHFAKKIGLIIEEGGFVQ
jgi:hypothetical protein